MIWLASHYMGLERQDLVVFVLWLYLTSSLSNNLTDLLVLPLLSWFLPLLKSNDLLLPLHVTLYWDIVRTTCYQALSLVTFGVNSWRQFSAPERVCRFDWQVRGCLLSRTSDAIWLLTFLFITSTFSICHGWWVRCQLNAVEQGLKHPILIILIQIMLQYIGRRLLWSACGTSMGI